MILAGTGHRPNKLGGYSQESFNILVRVAEDAIDTLKPDEVISGMALGWDQALAKAAINRDIPLIAAVPFFGQESMWPIKSRKYYQELISAAKDVIYVCDKGYAPWKMQMRNEYMVDKCNILLALWDGSQGGTGNCIAYAEKVNRTIVNFWDVYQKEIN